MDYSKTFDECGEIIKAYYSEIGENSKMKSYITEEIENLTDKELDSLINSLNQVKINRKNKKREKLIGEFKEAWDNLNKNGIDILVDDDYIYWGNITFD